MRSLIKFFSLTYAVSWACFITGGALPGTLGFATPVGLLIGSLLLAGTFAPAFVALAITAREDGRPGIENLYRRFEWPRVSRWYLFAIGYMAAIKLTVAGVHRVITGSWPPFGSELWYILAGAIVISTPVQAGEEIGWRGYALPRLAAHVGLARASVLLGVIWAFWHLPLFFVSGVSNYGQSFPLFMAGGVALSVAIAWLFAHTNGSLLMAMLMHSAVNQTIGIVPSAVPGATDPLAVSASLVGWLTLMFLWISAGYFLVRMPALEPLTRTPGNHSTASFSTAPGLSRSRHQR